VQHPSKHFISARHWPYIGFYIGPTPAADIGPTSAADIGPMSDVQLGYTSGQYRQPISAADMQPILCRHSKVIAFSRYNFLFLLLKPSANMTGKGKTGECINFNKFIYTNFKATFLAISKKALFLSVQWHEQVESSQLSTGRASVEGCIYYSDIRVLCCLWR